MAAEQSKTPEFLTVQEVADRLRVSKPTVYRAVEVGRIRAIRLGRTVRIHAAALEEFIAAGAPMTELWKWPQPPPRQ